MHYASVNAAAVTPAANALHTSRYARPARLAPHSASAHTRRLADYLNEADKSAPLSPYEATELRALLDRAERCCRRTSDPALLNELARSLGAVAHIADTTLITLMLRDLQRASHGPRTAHAPAAR